MLSHLVLSLRYLARAVKPRLPVEQAVIKAKEQASTLGRVKQHDPDERVDPDEIDQEGLAKIRLDDQHLPLMYLKRVQQVFGKYDQEQLRGIAKKFSELMSLRYQEKKFDYTKMKPFTRVMPELPHNRKVEQIHLVGEEKALKPDNQVKDTAPKEDEKPVGVGVQYNQNAVLSYLLNRVPRTFATAVRIFIQIKYKYPKFKPTSMIDFGSGLSSGSFAFADVFQQTKGLYNIEPNDKMFKLSKFLTQDLDIQHFRALGQLSRTVQDVDLVYAGYVLNEIQSQQIPIYVQALWTKVSPGGFLVISEYGNPYSARLIHDIRQWCIQRKITVVMPCPHQQSCPLAPTKRWCHFDQPSGMYTRKIFGKLPTDHAVQLEKFSYIVLHKPGDFQLQSQKSKKTNEWDRVLFPPIKRGGHILMDLCTTKGKLRKLVSARSHGEEYKEAKKLRWGDLWRFGERIPNKFRKESKRGKRLW